MFNLIPSRLRTHIDTAVSAFTGGDTDRGILRLTTGGGLLDDFEDLARGSDVANLLTSPVAVEEDAPEPRPLPRLVPGEISPDGLADPAIASLREGLLMRHEALEPEQYGFIAKCFEKAGGNPAVAQRLQKRYASEVRKASMFISREDEVAGFRRLVILGPSFGINNWSLYGVLDDGKMVSGFLDKKRGDPDLCVGEVLDQMRMRGEVRARSAFNLNRFAKNHKLIAHEIADRLIGGLPSNGVGKADHSARHAAVGVVSSRISRAMNLAVWAVTSAADPEIIRMMRSTQMTEFSHGQFLSGFRPQDAPFSERGDTLESCFRSSFCETRSIRRQQAVKAYPLMFKDFIEPKMRDAIDDGNSVAGEIAKKFDVPVSAVRNIQGVTWQKTAAKPFALKETIYHVMRVPRDFVPKNKKEFKALKTAVNLSYLKSNSVSDVLREVVKSGNPWDVISQMGDINTDDVNDFRNYLNKKLILPIARRIGLDPYGESLDPYGETTLQEQTQMYEAFDRILNSMSLKDMVAGSERWHRNIQRHNSLIDHLNVHEEWKPLLGHVDLPDGVVARELCSSMDLRNQGAKEGHCVGGYTNTVIRGENHLMTTIFSLEKAGDIIGTIELTTRLKKPQKKLDEEIDQPEKYETRIKQNRGKRNNDVSKTADLAGEALRVMHEKITPEQVETYVGHLSHVRRIRNAGDSLPRLISDAGYNIWDDEKLKIAFDELSVYLPRGIRRGGIQAIIDLMPEGKNREIVESEMLKDLTKIKNYQDALEKKSQGGEIEEPSKDRDLPRNMIDRAIAQEEFDHGEYPF